MKKNSLYHLVAGSVLFALGIYGILCLNIPLSPILLFISAFILCIPAGIPLSHWREVLSARPAIVHDPCPHEPVFLARLFLSMSWIARNCGILALEEFMTDKKYSNSLYHMGKNMIIDGIDPDFVKDTLENVIHLTRERSEAKARYLRQIGREFAFIGIFAGFSGTCAYGLRSLYLPESPLSGLGILFALTAISFMLSALFFLLIPEKIQCNGYQTGEIQRQMLQGLLALQEGDSYTAILHKQYTFLSSEEKGMLYEEPMFPEVKKINRDGNYDAIATDIRNTMRNFGLCLETGGADSGR